MIDVIKDVFSCVRTYQFVDADGYNEGIYEYLAPKIEEEEDTEDIDSRVW